jgi:hypothetical protein
MTAGLGQAQKCLNWIKESMTNSPTQKESFLGDLLYIKS